MNRALALFALFAIAAHAEESPATAGTTAPKAERYALKNRSVFSLTKETRPPFWPIGWSKTNSRPTASKTVVAAKPTAKLVPANFTVTSVLLGKPSLAMINGRSFGEGEYLPVIFDGQQMNVLLRRVMDGGVTLECEGQSALFVPLKRLEAVARPGGPEPVLQKGAAIIIESAPHKP